MTYSDGHRLDRHVHAWAQLVYASRGVMRVTTPTATWITPPTRAIWVPGGTPHEIEMRGEVAMRTLYLQPSPPAPTLAACRAIEVTPLLRELILHIVRLGMLRAQDPAHDRLEALLIDLLTAADTAPLELPMPLDPRARTLAKRLLETPDSRLDQAADMSGASLRTLQRRFQAETGLTLEAWRSRARLQRAVAALSRGASVTDAAFDCGFQSLSAFIAAFRRVFGVTPARWRRDATGSALGRGV